MIEIIVGVWFTSLLLSSLVVGFNFYLTRKRLSSERLKTLNFNLSKINMFWSNSLADFSPLSPQAVETDASKTLRNTLLMGLIGLASLPGFLFLTILVLSLHFLARSRKEVATFRSPLATDKGLSRSEVENLVNEFIHVF